MSITERRVRDFLKRCEALNHIPDYDELCDVVGISRNLASKYVNRLRRSGDISTYVASKSTHNRKPVFPQPPGHDPGKSAKVCTWKGCNHPRAPKSQWCAGHAEAWLSRCRHS